MRPSVGVSKTCSRRATRMALKRCQASLPLEAAYTCDGLSTVNRDSRNPLTHETTLRDEEPVVGFPRTMQN